MEKILPTLGKGGRDRPDALTESGFMEAWMRGGRPVNQGNQHATIHADLSMKYLAMRSKLVLIKAVHRR
jgi:hypothetical protein